MFGIIMIWSVIFVYKTAQVKSGPHAAKLNMKVPELIHLPKRTINQVNSAAAAARQIQIQRNDTKDTTLPIGYRKQGLPVGAKLKFASSNDGSVNLGDARSRMGDFNNVAFVMKNNSEMCPNLYKDVNPEPDLLYDTWYVSPLSAYLTIYSFSVYYDDRADGGVVPLVRLLGVSRTIVNQTLYCQIWYPNVDQPYTVEVQVRKNGGGHKINRTHYEQYYYNCQLPASYPVPDYVSIVMNRCDQPAVHIPIYVPVRTPWVHEFGVCVPVAFWYVDPYRIIEWIEAMRALGVGEFNVYHVKMNESSLNALRYYEEKGIVRLVHIPAVPHYEKSRGGTKIGSPISINDCLYRNMYRYKWAAVIDFDELIVPEKANSLSDLLKDIDKKEKLPLPAPSYTFRNAYYWSGCPDDAKTPKNHYILRLLRKDKPNGAMFAPKSILNPRRCKSAFNHYCFHRFPMSRKEKWTIDVSPEFATSHHYRQLYPGKKGELKCLEVKKESVIDKRILKWQKTILERTTKVHKELGM